MAEEIENSDSSNGEPDEQEEELDTDVVDEIDDSAVLKEKLEKAQKANSQLFERTKKAEGFVKDDAGKWVKKPVEPAPEKEPEKEPTAEEITDEKLDKALEDKLEKRELNSFDISDDLKKEVGAYAKLNGVSVKKARDSPYIQFRVKEVESADNADEASLGGGKGKTAKTEIVGEGNFDLTTEKGRKDFAKWEEQKREELG